MYSKVEIEDYINYEKWVIDKDTELMIEEQRLFNYNDLPWSLWDVDL